MHVRICALSYMMQQHEKVITFAQWHLLFPFLPLQWADPSELPSARAADTLLSQFITECNTKDWCWQGWCDLKNSICTENSREKLWGKQLHAAHFKQKTQRWWVWEGEGAGFCSVVNGHCAWFATHPKRRDKRMAPGMAPQHRDEVGSPSEVGAQWKTARDIHQHHNHVPTWTQPALNKGLTRTNQPPTASRSGGAGRLRAQQRGRKDESEGNADRLTSPPTAPGPGSLPVPAAGTASLPSSACPGLAARCAGSSLGEPCLCRACGAALQMGTAACISGSTGRSTWAAASLLWTVASYFFILFFFPFPSRWTLVRK